MMLLYVYMKLKYCYYYDKNKINKNKERIMFYLKILDLKLFLRQLFVFPMSVK